MKKVVTGFDEGGKSIFISVDQPKITYENEGFRWLELWNSYADDKLPIDPPCGPKRETVNGSVFPDVGKSIFRIIEFSPYTFDTTAISEQETQRLNSCLPGLIDHVEADNPGMHATDSIDYGVIISGKITMELDDGECTELGPGDVWIQNGTRHAWRVTEKCSMAVVLVGVEREK